MNITTTLRFAVLCAAFAVLAGCVPPKTRPTRDGVGLDDLSPAKDKMMWLNSPYNEQTRITFSDAGEDFDPSLSADGQTLVFASTKISTKSDIFRKKIDSKVVEQVTHTPNASEKQAQISPDGKTIIYASDKEGRFNIYEISAESAGARELEVVRNERINEQPCYSPDGTMIAYVTWVPKKNDWWIATMNRRTQQEKLYGPGLFPRFSPDSKKLVFQKARVRVPQWFSLWILDLENETVSEIVSNDQWAAITPAWSPDGKRLVFASVCKSAKVASPMEADDIYTVWADGTHLLRLTEEDSPDWSPVWASTGRVFFVSKRGGHQNVWSIKPRDIDRFHPDTVETVKAAPQSLDSL